MPSSFEPTDSTPIAHVSFQTAVPSPDERPWYQRKPTPTVIALGTAGALAFAILLGLLLSPPMKRADREPVEKASAEVTTPQSLVEQFTFARASEPYQPPSAAQVEKAYAVSQQVFREGGVSELARYGLQCFRSLEKKPSYGLMDFCLAFDLFAEAQHNRLTAGERPSTASWFGSTGARHQNVAQSVMTVEGDAAARLLDLRRLAAETAKRSGDVIAASLALPTNPMGLTTPAAGAASIPASAPADQLTVQVEPALAPPAAASPALAVANSGPAARPAPRRPAAAPPAEPQERPATASEGSLDRQLLDVVEEAVAPAAVAEPALPPAPQ